MGVADVRRLILTWLIALCAMTTPAFAEGNAAWWNKDWLYRRAVTVDTSPSGTNLAGSAGRTVLLVRLHPGNFTFTDAMENGADLRVVDSDGKTPLPFHIERFDAQNGMATLWVSVPNVNGGEKRQLWLYFGNKSAPAGSDVAGTYDPDTVAVWHFGETAGQPLKDLTANHNNGQNGAPGVDENGIVARAAKFNGQGGITIPASPSLDVAAGGSFSFAGWVKPDQVAGEQAIFAHGALVIGIAEGLPYAKVGDQRIAGHVPLKGGEWAQLGLVADGKNIRLYVNGVEAAAAPAALPALVGPVSLGGAYAGELDEVRLSKTALPAPAVLASAQSEGPAGKLVRVTETPERQSEGGGNFFYVLGKIESIDAVIIGLCLVLLALSMSVTIVKTRYLNGAMKGDRAFSRRYAAMHEQLVSLKQDAGIDMTEHETLGRSPLVRIFEMGLDELGVRRKERGLVALSGASVEAMRSAVDAVVVRENQKLDRWMVVLSIAISGGPFIGLFGTVIGVMNTFAGVARAGDVNVNAIAPGIAAALMATVAGLLAAIPSLFANNYLAGRIQTLSDDMRVFADRLITRLAEMQENQATPPSRKVAA
jgi:biopolymer transport protein ExbB